MKKAKVFMVLIMALLFSFGCTSLDVTDFESIPIGNKGFNIYLPNGNDFAVEKTPLELGDSSCLVIAGEADIKGSGISFDIEYLQTSKSIFDEYVEPDVFLGNLALTWDEFKFSMNGESIYRGSQAATMSYKDYRESGINLIQTEIIIKSFISNDILLKRSSIFIYKNDVVYITMLYDAEDREVAATLEQRIIQNSFARI